MATVSDEEWAEIVRAQNARLKEQGFDPEGADAAILDFDGPGDPMADEGAKKATCRVAA